MKKKIWQDPEWLREMYWEQEKSTRQIAKIANCGVSTVKRKLRQFGIPLRASAIGRSLRAEADRKAEGEKIWQDADWLRKMYWEQGKSVRQIAELTKSPSSSIRYWMKKHDISLRTSAEGIRLRFQDLKFRQKIAEANRRKTQRPGWRKKLSEAAYYRNQDPDYRKKYDEAMHKLWRNPEHRRKTREAIRRKFQDPEFRRKIIEANRRKAQDPEWKKKHAEAMKRLPQNPKWQKNHAEAMQRLALKKRDAGEMTDIEDICYAAFETLDLVFIFEMFIKPYRVDFFFPSHGVIVEANGEYWHKVPAKLEKDIDRKEFLEACGFTVLEWWGEDIKADVFKLIDDELLPLLEQPPRMERVPPGATKPFKGERGWSSATQLYLPELAK